MTVGKQTYTDKKEAGKALALEILAKANEKQFVKVGEFAGFELQVMKLDRLMAASKGSEYLGQIVGAQSYPFDIKQFYLDSPTHLANEVAKKVEAIDSNLKRWQYELEKTKTDLAAQEKLSKEPFAKQAELDTKTKRFDEVMAILNPQEEQALDDVDNDTQYQERDYLDDEGAIQYDRSSKRSAYSETETLFLQWSHGSAPVGEVKSFIRYGKHHFYEKTADYCVELSRAQYNERKNIDGENAYTRVQRQINGAADKNGYAEGNLSGRMDGNRNSGRAEVLSGYTVGEELRNDAGRSVSSGRRNNNSVSEVNEEDTQYQNRSSALSDREVLELAASGVSFDNLTEAEKNALEIFDKHLDELAKLQEERVDLGRQYKQQQFEKGGSRQEAAKILNAMKVLDVKIVNAENELISLENKDVLKKVLVKARKVVETKEQIHGQEALRKYRMKREESLAVKKYRARVRNDVETLRKWLVSPSNKDIVKHVPAEIQKSVADFLDSINLMSKTALKTSGLVTTKADDGNEKLVKTFVNPFVNFFVSFTQFYAEFIKFELAKVANKGIRESKKMY